MDESRAANDTRPTTIALVITVLFGATIGILAILDVPGIGVIAGIGGILVGLMWVAVTAIRRGRASRRDT